VASHDPQVWNQVTSRATNKVKAREGRKEKGALSRATLLQGHTIQAYDFSALHLRNSINSAFRAKGIEKLVVSTISLSLRGNIVVYTTPDFNSEFLQQNQAILASVFPNLIKIQGGEAWYKVLIHSIPIADFDNEEGMDLIVEEIKTFNKGLTPIGRPYWATSRDKRQNGFTRSGSVVVAFPTEIQAKRAIQNRLYIAGISARVEKYYTVASTVQCNKCTGFGHVEHLCKRSPKCILCGEDHVIQEHYCSICKKKGSSCNHLTPKCNNCQGTHLASNKLCEVYLAVKAKATKPKSHDYE